MSLRKRVARANEHSTVVCTTFSPAGGSLIRAAWGPWWEAEDDLDVSIIHLDAPNLELKDIGFGRPVQNTEALAHASGEELRLANNQDQCALCFARGPDLPALLPQFRYRAPKIGDARLGLAPFDHVLSITVDEPADPARSVEMRRSALPKSTALPILPFTAVKRCCYSWSIRAGSFKMASTSVQTKRPMQSLRTDRLVKNRFPRTDGRHYQCSDRHRSRRGCVDGARRSRRWACCNTRSCNADTRPSPGAAFERG
jgi:hypothetical protein